VTDLKVASCDEVANLSDDSYCWFMCFRQSTMTTTRHLGLCVVLSMQCCLFKFLPNSFWTLKFMKFVQTAEF